MMSHNIDIIIIYTYALLHNTVNLEILANISRYTVIVVYHEILSFDQELYFN